MDNTYKHPLAGGTVSPIKQKLISKREAAQYLGISIRFLCALLSERAITCIRLGGRVLFDPSDLDAFIDSQKIKAQGWKGSR